LFFSRRIEELCRDITSLICQTAALLCKRAFPSLILNMLECFPFWKHCSGWLDWINAFYVFNFLWQWLFAKNPKFVLRKPKALSTDTLI
jgi:hypothetical protein